MAYHSCAAIEAEMRGLYEDLAAEFGEEGDSTLSDALAYCDLTTGPDGQRLTIEERLAAITAR